nr:immunoglobulin light chain junction region [Macaca mulatta]
CMQALKFPWMF